MKKIVLLVLLFFYLFSYGQNIPASLSSVTQDSLTVVIAGTKTDTLPQNERIFPALNSPQMTWNSYTKAAVNAVGINLGVWGFDRFVLNTNYSRISLNTITANITHPPVWDTDKFSTNLLMHPYHGSMYFNGARLNGFDFYKSVPFSLGGSLMWEYFMENELPSINDLTATTLGGAALGEVAFRLSDNILDNRATGFNRFAREFIGGILSPSRFIQRVGTGKMWHRETTKGNLEKLILIDVHFNLGYRLNYRKEDFEVRSASITADADYGNIFDVEVKKPYDWFQLRFQADMIDAKPYVNHVNLIGVIHNGKIFEYKNTKFHGGLFQHFNFYQSHIKLKSGEYVIPYYISEVSAAGPGLLFENRKKKSKIDGKLFVNAILLGASYSDYIRIDDKDYNLGSGYSLKLNANIQLSKKWYFSLNVEDYYIYTWKGADETIEYKDISLKDWGAYSFQGDKSKAHLTVVEFKSRYQLTEKFCIEINSCQFFRKTHYKYFPDVSYASFENFISLGIKV